MAIKVGIQLFSVRDWMAKDPFSTIGKVAELGYKYIEPANHNADHDDGVGFGVRPAELNKILDQYGSKVVSAHVYPLSIDNLKRAIQYNLAIGNHTIVEGMGRFQKADDVYRSCEYYNEAGKLCSESGIRLLYHNHHHEYQTIGGKTILDLIVENTDPDYVGFELDTFWTMRGGKNPIEIMKKLGTRLKLVHQKDFAKDSPNPINLLTVIGEEFRERTDLDLMGNLDYTKDFTEIGTGIMDIQKIIDEANKLGSVDYIILEQDCTKYDQLESIKLSMDAFKKYTSISWE